MLTGPGQWKRARAEVHRLHRKIQRGEATEADRTRHEEGFLELLCWEWAEQGSRGKPRELDVRVPLPARDPIAIRFVNWYERNRGRLQITDGEDNLVDFTWPDVLPLWSEPLRLTDEHAVRIFYDAQDEFHERRMMRAKQEKRVA